VPLVITLVLLLVAGAAGGAWLVAARLGVTLDLGADKPDKAPAKSP
jgi:hypothetical protein